MSKTVVYVRVSTDKQDLENQRYEARKFCERRGFDVDEWVEEVVTGTAQVKDRRIGLVLDQLTEGDTLIVSELSRLSRNLLNVMEVLKYCLERGITIYTIKEGYTLGNDIQSKVMAFAFGLAAEIERNMISQRTKEALARKKAEGAVLGRPVGTGKPEHYKLHGKDEELVKLIRARVSYSAMARMFNVHRLTVTSYIRAHDLRRKALEESGV